MTAPPLELRPTGRIPRGCGRIPNDRHPRNAWRDLLEQLQPFPAHTVFDRANPVALPPGRARLATKPPPTGSMTPQTRSASGGSPVATPYNRVRRANDDVRRERDQFCCVSAKAVGIARAPAVVDPHVAAGDPAQFLQPLRERRTRRAVIPDRRRRGSSVRRCAASGSLCCARAASGHAAAPPSSVMNSRRLIRLPRRQAREFCQEPAGQAPLRC